LPFEKLVHELNPERGSGHNPLFQVHFQLFSDQSAEEGESYLSGEVFDVSTETAKFDMALDLWEYPDGLYAHLEYSTELFDAATISRMESRFRTLLEEVVRDPDQPISTLSIMDARERHLLLHTWAESEAGFRRDACLNELFEMQAEMTPDAIALIFRQHSLT